MPYTPTSWDDIGEDLRRLFREIICSDGGPLSRILREAVNPPAGVSSVNFYAHCTTNSPNAKAIAASRFNDKIFIDACWDFMEYQRDLCKKNGSDIQYEGFQVGSPWHGDILQAPVLFLSINPAITHRCFFPRWHPSADGTPDRFTLAGLDANGNSAYSLTDINGNSIANDITNDSDRKIYDFLTRRFQDTAETTNGHPRAVIVDAGTKTCLGMTEIVKGEVREKLQSYWNGMALVMNDLLDFPTKKDPSRPARKLSEHIKRLMRSVLSAEVIFWGTKSQADAGNKDKKTLDARLDYFWEKFVVPLLENCGAKILFIVGAQKHYTQAVFNRASALQNGTLRKLYKNRFGKEFRIAAINNLSQSPYNYAKVVQQLKDEAKKPGIVCDALYEATRLYYS